MIIREFIPAAKSGGRPRKLEIREVVNAFLQVVAGGVQWRMLPNEYPRWQSVYRYFKQWRDSGLWQRPHDTLRARLRQRSGRHKHPTAGCLDSQSVKTTSIAGVRGYDKGKQINGRKRHIVVDTLGLLLAVVVTTASVQDRDGAFMLFPRLGGGCKKLRCIRVDGGDRGALVTWVAQHLRFRLKVVLRAEAQNGIKVLSRRRLVERTSAWFNHHRHSSKDCERLIGTSEAMVHIVMIRFMVRRLAPQ